MKISYHGRAVLLRGARDLEGRYDRSDWWVVQGLAVGAGHRGKSVVVLVAGILDSVGRRQPLETKGVRRG